MVGAMGTYGGLWGRMGGYGDVWGAMGTYGGYGDIWWGLWGHMVGAMGTYGGLWGRMGGYGDIAPPPTSNKASLTSCLLEGLCELRDSRLHK